MDIVIINGSPKYGKSCSEYLLKTITNDIDKENNIYDISIVDKKIGNDEKFYVMANCEKILMACPLYIDCLPSIVINFLEEFDCYLKGNKLKNEVKLYVVVNSGFIEGIQNKYALKVFENYTNHIENLSYAGGIGIGGGEFLGVSEGIPWKVKIKAGVKEAMANLMTAINTGNSLREDIFVDINMNKRLYALAGEVGWITSGFKNKVYIGSFNKKHYK